MRNAHRAENTHIPDDLAETMNLVEISSIDKEKAKPRVVSRTVSNPASDGRPGDAGKGKTRSGPRRKNGTAPQHEPPTPQLDKLLCFALYVTARASEAKYRPILSALGLTYPRYIVLLVLREHDAISLSALGSRLHLDSATLSPLLKGMEADGLVQRRRNPRDERSIHVNLTDKGRETAAKAIVAAESLACSMDLPADEMARIRDDVKRVHAALKLPRK